MRIAKDPIDFIRNFRFAIYKPNVGSTAGPTRKDVNLVINLIKPNEIVSADTACVTLTRGTIVSDSTVVADYLAKRQDIQILPYAAIIDGNHAVSINLCVMGIDSFKLQQDLEAVLAHVAWVKLTTSDQKIGVLMPSYERDAMNQNNGGGNFGGSRQTIGQPRPGGDSRLPQGSGWNNDNGNNNF